MSIFPFLSMNPIGPEHLHMRYILEKKKNFNDLKLIAEQYYLLNDKKNLTYAQASHYEVAYYTEVCEAQQKEVDRLIAKEQLLDHMINRFNRTYDMKYHNFKHRQERKSNEQSYKAFVKSRVSQTKNHFEASSSHD